MAVLVAAVTAFPSVLAVVLAAHRGKRRTAIVHSENRKDHTELLHAVSRLRAEVVALGNRLDQHQKQHHHLNGQM